MPSEVSLLVYFNSQKTFLKKCLLHGISRAADKKKKKERKLSFKILVKRKMLVSKMSASKENCSFVAFCLS